MPTSQIQLLLTLRAIILECEWGMETPGTLGNTLGTWWRGWAPRVGAKCRREPECRTVLGSREQACRSQMQRWKQSSCIDLKRQFSEIDAASLALPGPPSSRQVCERHTPTLGGSEPSTLYAGGELQGVEIRRGVFIWQDEKERETEKRWEGKRKGLFSWMNVI